MASVIAPFQRHKLACRGMSQEIFSPPAPAGAGVLGWNRLQGFAKSAHPWLSSLRSSGAEHPRPNGRATALANLRASSEMYKLQTRAGRPCHESTFSGECITDYSKAGWRLVRLFLSIAQQFLV